MKPHAWKIEWNEGMSVGIPEVDADHKRLVTLIEDLNRAIVDRLELDQIKQRLQAILDDTVEHFSREEKLLRECRYPDVEYHARKHADVLKALLAIQERFIVYGLQSEWIGTGLEVKNILIDHLLTEDMKYAEFYRNEIQARGTR